MRQIHTYRLVRYFPHMLSDEFVNIGVVLTSAKGVDRVLSEEEARQIHCAPLIGEKKKFMGVVEYLNRLSAEGKLLEGEHYFQNFRFADEQKVASDKADTEVLNELFEDYIGYKIQAEEKREEKVLILEQSLKLAESSSFRKYIRVRRDSTALFDLEIESVRKQIMHHSVIGKTTHKQDVARMVMATPDHKEAKRRYDFLNINGKYDADNPYVKKLEQNLVDPYPYKTEEQIAGYLELVAS